MRRHAHRRKVERVRLFPPLPGRVAKINAEVVELSLHGARVQHYQPLEVNARVPLSFEWRDHDIAMHSEVVRCVSESFGASTVYKSGLRFVASDSSYFALQDLICAHIEDALDRQVANASGDTARLTAAEQMTIFSIVPRDTERALLRIRANRDEGYVRYDYLGGEWERTDTSDSGQPHDGFTIWSFEDDENVEELCRIYAGANEEVRALIRGCAELSLFVESDGLIPQDFEP